MKGTEFLPQTQIVIILSNKITSSKYQRSTALGCKDKGIRK